MKKFNDFNDFPEENLNLIKLQEEFESTEPVLETKKIVLSSDQVERINNYLTKKVNMLYDYKSMGITSITIDISNVISDRDAHLSVYSLPDGGNLNVMWIDSDRYRFNEVLLANSDWTEFSLDHRLNGGY